jgi:hypothetical protein
MSSPVHVVRISWCSTGTHAATLPPEWQFLTQASTFQALYAKLLRGSWSILPSSTCKQTSATAWCWSSSTWRPFAFLACFTSCWKFMEQVTISSGLNLRFLLISDGGEGVAVAAGRIAPAEVTAKTWTPLVFGIESRRAICCTVLQWWCTASRTLVALHTFESIARASLRR